MMFKLVKQQSAPRSDARSKQGTPLRITVIGPPAGGKSTMLANLRHAIDAAASSAGFRIAFYPHRLSELPLDTELQGDIVMDKPMTGVMSRGRARYLVEISDSVGGLLTSETDLDETQPRNQWPVLFQRTVESDLLIVTVDPATVCDDDKLQKVRTAVTQHLHLLSRHKPEAMVAIAFTKADEYGIVGATRFRFIDTRERREAFKRWCEGQDHAHDRQEFISALTTPADEASGAIGEIMKQAGHLFRDTIQLANPDGVNAYLVSARPIEPPVIPYPLQRRGMIEIFADFFKQTRARWPRPTVPLWVSAGLFVLTSRLLGWPMFVFALVVVAVVVSIWFYKRSQSK